MGCKAYGLEDILGEDVAKLYDTKTCLADRRVVAVWIHVGGAVRTAKRDDGFIIEEISRCRRSIMDQT